MEPKNTASIPSHTLVDRINRHYDKVMYGANIADFYSGSDYTNYGFWAPGIKNAKDAGDCLMENLLAYIPNKKGKILDVACGKGETSKYLSRYYEIANIYGINISDKQLADCQINLPGATFLCMDATKLDFPDCFFEAVICVEAAFHFNTRGLFFDEAFRVLKPGGVLVLSDILYTHDIEDYHQRTVAENYISDIESYRSILQNIGFTGISIRDATEPCWHGHFRYALKYGHERLLQRKISLDHLKAQAEVYYDRFMYTKAYLLAAAAKPND